MPRRIASQRRRTHVEQFLRFARQGAETVCQAALEGLQRGFVLGRVELAVELQAFGLLCHVGIGQPGLDLYFDVRVIHIMHLLHRHPARRHPDPPPASLSARSSAIASFMIFW